MWSWRLTSQTPDRERSDEIAADPATDQGVEVGNERLAGYLRAITPEFPGTGPQPLASQIPIQNAPHQGLVDGVSVDLGDDTLPGDREDRAELLDVRGVRVDMRRPGAPEGR
jgi:hypothetical protein